MPRRRSCRRRLRSRRAEIERRHHERFVDVEQLGGEGDETVDRKPAMAIDRRLLQGEGHTGAQPLRGFASHAHFQGHGVGRPKANASDVAGKPIRILGHHLNGVMAIGFEDAHRARRSNTMGMQKHHDVPNGLLLGPAGGDFSSAEFSDPDTSLSFSGVASMISKVPTPNASTIRFASFGPMPLASFPSQDISRCPRRWSAGWF